MMGLGGGRPCIILPFSSGLDEHEAAAEGLGRADAGEKDLFEFFRISHCQIPCKINTAKTNIRIPFFP